MRDDGQHHGQGEQESDHDNDQDIMGQINRKVTKEQQFSLQDPFFVQHNIYNKNQGKEIILSWFFFC